MTRVKRGTIAHKKREKILRKVKGYKWGRKSKERAAKEALLHAGVHSFRGRKEKKRNFRALWQVQINAAARQNNTTYSKLIAALKKKNIELDRKILAQIANQYPKIFTKIVESVK
ncbi:MAG: 50S ribosomal protein L20 [Patescibacteria group bacterium]|nr:50S ribosomal protein L20 [Patescibacteria group bacterium]